MYIYTTKKSCPSIPCPASMLMLCFRGKIRRKASRRRVRIRKRRGGGRKGKVRVLFLGDKRVTECVFSFQRCLRPELQVFGMEVESTGFLVTWFQSHRLICVCCVLAMLH
jgi:hypothetical protein